MNRDDPANYTDKITSLVLCKDLEEGYPLVLTGILLPRGRVLLLRACLECCPRCTMNCLNWQLMQGVQDLCSYEKANRLENIISGLTSKDLNCKFCKKNIEFKYQAEEPPEV